jgi:hypothetical protein
LAPVADVAVGVVVRVAPDEAARVAVGVLRAEAAAVVAVAR